MTDTEPHQGAAPPIAIDRAPDGRLTLRLHRGGHPVELALSDDEAASIRLARAGPPRGNSEGVMTYRVIYADPPWHWSPRGAPSRRHAAAHYPTMTLGRSIALRARIDAWAAPDCALFMWALDSMIPDALFLLDAWGFAFKTVAFTWVKTGRDGIPMGMGYWTRANPEQCWLATRGRPKRARADAPQCIHAPRREHSRKPDEVADAIVRLMGDVPRLELFARTQRPGWRAWGNETEKFAETGPSGRAA